MLFFAQLLCLQCFDAVSWVAERASGLQKNFKLWGTGMLHMAQLMPLPLTVSCCSKIQIGFTFLVPAHPGSPGKRAVKRVWVVICKLPSVLWHYWFLHWVVDRLRCLLLKALKEGREPDHSDYKKFKLTCENVGFQMLQKMGWKEGEGLGSEGQGIKNPVNKYELLLCHCDYFFASGHPVDEAKERRYYVFSCPSVDVYVQTCLLVEAFSNQLAIGFSCFGDTVCIVKLSHLVKSRKCPSQSLVLPSDVCASALALKT